MLLTTNKDIVVKRITDTALICSCPCWVLWIKVVLVAPPVSALTMFYNGFDLNAEAVMSFGGRAGKGDRAILIMPIRFKKGLFIGVTAAIDTLMVGYIPDY